MKFAGESLDSSPGGVTAHEELGALSVCYGPCVGETRTITGERTPSFGFGTPGVDGGRFCYINP